MVRWRSFKVKKGKGELRRGAHLHYVGREPVGGYVTHGQASGRHPPPFDGTKLYGLVTQAHRCK